jgi:hypothetical protein
MEVEHSPNPQVSRGVYGFVLYLFFVSFIAIYFLWIIIPTSVTKTWTYEPPQKYWAVAVPVFFCTVLFLFAFCIYPAMNSLHDGRMEEMSSIQDKNSIPSSILNEIPVYDEPLDEGRGRRRSLRISGNQVETFADLKLYGNNVEVHPQREIPPASDLDINEVCRLLYLNQRR